MTETSPLDPFSVFFFQGVFGMDFRGKNEILQKKRRKSRKIDINYVNCWGYPAIPGATWRFLGLLGDLWGYLAEG